jgi:hypothetical protein
MQQGRQTVIFPEEIKKNKDVWMICCVIVKLLIVRKLNMRALCGIQVSQKVNLISMK